MSHWVQSRWPVKGTIACGRAPCPKPGSKVRVTDFPAPDVNGCGGPGNLFGLNRNTRHGGRFPETNPHLSHSWRAVGGGGNQLPSLGLVGLLGFQSCLSGLRHDLNVERDFMKATCFEGDCLAVNFSFKRWCAACGS